MSARVGHPPEKAAGASETVARPEILRRIPLDRSSVIEASAGTGKTFTLEHLVVELVLATGVPLDRVLVVTFTEKATNELRVRVRAKLEELLAGRGAAPADAQREAGDVWVLDEAARGKLARALHAFDGVTIATIHAFCQRVLRDNAFASGRLFEEEQVDARDAFARAFEEALRREVARDPARAPWLEAAMRAGWSIEEVETLLWSVVQAKGELRPVFDPARLDAALAAFPVDEALLREGPATMKTWGVHGATARTLGSRLYELALRVESARESGGASSFVLSAGDVDLRYVVEKLAPHLPRPGATGAACAAAVELAHATPPFQAALVYAVLPPVREELARRKRAAGQYDFDDMLALLDEGLRGPRGEALARAMRERWRFVLVDEFQDTDETQWSILRRAFFEPLEGAPSVLCLVGDPKQSIYRFRGADVDTYLRACGDVAGAGGEPLRLPASFRGTPALVEAHNAIFTGPFFSGAIEYAPVGCGRPDRTLTDAQGRAVTPCHVFRFEGEVSQAALGALVARSIREIVDGAHGLRLDGRPLEHRDVFVLTRSRAEGRAVGEALRAGGVPYAFYKEDGLFQTDEAREVCTLLAAIDDPADRARRVAVWMTRFFAVSVEDLERTRDLPASHPLVARLQSWKTLAETRDFERLFESLVRDSGVVRREIFFAEGERELTNYLHVLELLLEHARRTHATLRDLVHLLSGLVDGTRLPLEMEGNVQRLESERRAVQVMTIHKAKGLEAAVVFVAGGWSSGRADGVRVTHEAGRRLAWVGKVDGEVKTRAAAEEREENERLMYVALTRAQGRVVLPCVVRDGAPVPLRGPYDVVNRSVAELVRQGHPLVSVEDAPRLTLASSRAANEAGAGEWEPPAALLHGGPARDDHAALREAHAGAVVTSYTRMRGARAGARSAWEPEAAERRAAERGEDVEAAAAVTLRSSRTSGVFLHEVLQRLDLASFAAESFDAWRERPDVRALFDDAMAVHRVGAPERGHAERLAWAAYTARVALPGGPVLERLAGADHVVREMEFVFPLAEGRAFARGALDLVFEHRGLTYFVDWKTDSLPSYDPERLGEHVSRHYEPQVQLYALATAKLIGIASAADHGARFGGILYFFLRGLDGRGAGIWTSRPRWEQLGEWEEALRAPARWRRRS